jgi:hypothetical protein
MRIVHPSAIVKLAASLVVLTAVTASADVSADGDQPAGIIAQPAISSSGSTQRSSAASEPKKDYPPYADVLKGAQAIEGLVKLHRKEDRLYGELSTASLDKDFIVLVAIARGMGERPVIGGMTWNLGDDWIWRFRRADNKIQIVRRNVRFTAAKGSPEEKAVRLAYTDSVLFSLPIATMSPTGAYVVDLTSVFMSDLPLISQGLRGFTFSRDKSSWAAVKGFKDNVEIQVAATYASSGTRKMDTVADSRGVTINVHYSISRLPETGYQPRLADDRIGHFLTALKDYSKESGRDRFVRYINRWDLRKADPKAELSPPKKAIIFWLERTVPFEYRKPIREGILEWNRAFEKVGLANALEVRQQPDDAQWDPEDINYNTFRWITSSAGFAMGPSRVNPTTGEILDADILFDADFVQSWRSDYKTLTPDQSNELTDGLDRLAAHGAGVPLHVCQRHHCRCDLPRGMARQLAFASVVFAAEEDKKAAQAQLKKLILQGIREVAMHEVGHTLGLRHNFKASTWLSVEAINDPGKTSGTGLAASVMDYLPVNFVPKGKKQGDYFSKTIGPYDYWAIEYAYKPLSGGTQGELAELKKIASRCTEPALAYATDDDTRSTDPDPLVNQFDLGKDVLEFARRRVELFHQLVPGLVDRMVADGQGYQPARDALNDLLSYHGSAMRAAARFIGGLYVHRDHKGDPNARPPFVVVEAKRQREALELLDQEVFGEHAYQLPRELYNYLADEKWSHWGMQSRNRVDYPVHEIVLSWQDRVLAQLLSSTTLSRIIDSELKLPPGHDAFTAADLLEGLTGAVFRELERLRGGKHTNRKPAISSLRRSLQRRYLERLSNLALGSASAPEDCQTLAFAELEALEARMNRVLAGKAQLDSYTRAHLRESVSRIRKVLEARIELRSP